MKTQLKVKLKFTKYNGCGHFIEMNKVKNYFKPVKISQHNISIV